MNYRSYAEYAVRFVKVDVAKIGEILENMETEQHFKELIIFVTLGSKIPYFKEINDKKFALFKF